MASKNAETTKLQSILESQVAKGDKEKALEEVAKVVKTASRAARGEKESAEDAVDMAKDRLEKVISNPSSSLTQIVEARRDVKIAEANAEEIAAEMASRF